MENQYFPLWDYLRQIERSMAWLARKIGVTPNYLVQIHTNRCPASKRFRRRCAEVLGKSEAELFGASSEQVA